MASELLELQHVTKGGQLVTEGGQLYELAAEQQPAREYKLLFLADGAPARRRPRRRLWPRDAHADLGCMFRDEMDLIQKPRWRVASSADVRSVRRRNVEEVGTALPHTIVAATRLWRSTLGELVSSRRSCTFDSGRLGLLACWRLRRQGAFLRKETSRWERA